MIDYQMSGFTPPNTTSIPTASYPKAYAAPRSCFVTQNSVALSGPYITRHYTHKVYTSPPKKLRNTKPYITG